MENVTRALIMAFSMLVFVIGFSFSMYLINKLTTTSSTLLSSINTTNYYDNIKVRGDTNKTRDVSIETIASTLYRYYKENYAVKIYIDPDKDGKHKLLQVFDVSIEGKIAKAAAANQPNEEQTSLKKSPFNDSRKRVYLFEAPWTGSTDDATRMRIDYFLNGSRGYINNTLVNYSNDSSAFKGITGGFYGYCKQDANTNKTFEESFIEYNYTGETVSVTDESGNDLRNRKYNRKFKSKFKDYSNI